MTYREAAEQVKALKAELEAQSDIEIICLSKAIEALETLALQKNTINGYDRGYELGWLRAKIDNLEENRKAYSEGFGKGIDYAYDEMGVKE